MDDSQPNSEAALKLLQQILSVELKEIADSLVKGFGEPDNPYTIELPEDFTVDLPLPVLSSLVARSANKYGLAARAAGIARAQAKIAKGRYEGKYKRSKIGKNEAEREANAMGACQEEHNSWLLAEGLAEIAEAIESGSRISSESVRKMLGAAEFQQQAVLREGKGVYSERDFSR